MRVRLRGDVHDGMDSHGWVRERRQLFIVSLWCFYRVLLVLYKTNMGTGWRYRKIGNRIGGVIPKTEKKRSNKFLAGMKASEGLEFPGDFSSFPRFRSCWVLPRAFLVLLYRPAFPR